MTELDFCGLKLLSAGERGQKFDLHTHSAFSDGKDPAEEMVRAALEKGMTCYGISDHSYVPWDDCGMSRESTAKCREEMERLRAKYAGRIHLLRGLERDWFSDDFGDYDYVIGSVHWIEMPDGHHLPVDWTAEKLRLGVDKYFGGDFYAMAESYFDMAGRVVEKTKCDIIGHFDLVAKFNEGNGLFREDHPRYVSAWQRAADRLLETGRIFEINTGALSRGYRSDPYPARPIRAYLREKGAKMILSSDAHRKENIGYGFAGFRG